MNCEVGFRDYDVDQRYLLPPSMREWLPEDDLVYFVIDVVGKLERATYHQIPFRVLTGDQQPDHDTIADFRKRHLKALSGLFVQVLRLCRKSGLVKLGHVSLDGTKVRANASKHKAMSYGRMEKKAKELEEEVKRLLKEAEQVDAEEDQQYGKGKRGDELPEDLRYRKSRLEKIKKAMAELEEEAREQAEEKRKELAEREEEEKRTGKKRRGRKPKEPSIEKLKENIPDRKPTKISADSGYFSKENVEYLQQEAIDPYIATGRMKHGEKNLPAPRGAIPKNATVKERMARKLRTQKGSEVYRKRKQIPEPVFGQIKEVRGFRRFLLRGLDNVSAEWDIVCLTHNILKLFRSRKTLVRA